MRFVLTVLSMLAAAPAWAEWVKVSESDLAVWYLDPATIRKDGSLRRVWRIKDHHKHQVSSDGIASYRNLDEYDCKDERFRTIVWSAHSGPMATGVILQSSDNNPYGGTWIYIPPATIEAGWLKFVCSR